MDIGLFSLLYSAQNSCKHVPFYGSSGFYVAQTPGICFGIVQAILPGTPPLSSCQEGGGRMRNPGTMYFLKQYKRLTLGIPLHSGVLSHFTY